MTVLRVVLRVVALAWLAGGIGAGMVGVVEALRVGYLSVEALGGLEVGLACTLTGSLLALLALLEGLADW